MDKSDFYLEEYHNEYQDYLGSVNRSEQDFHSSLGISGFSLMNNSEMHQSSFQNANDTMDTSEYRDVKIGKYKNSVYRSCPDLRLSLGMSVVTLVTNSVICIVLLQKHMRNATNTLLVAMAVADLLTSILPAPPRFYFEVLGNMDEWVPYNWCHYNHYFSPQLFEGLAVPMIFHNASIWITVFLAAQRCISLHCPSLAKRICTVKAALLSIAVTVALVFAACWADFLLIPKISPVTIKSRIHVNRTIVGCTVDRTHVMKILLMLKNRDLLVIALFNYLIPCSCLVILNSVLVATLWKAYLRRKQILNRTQRASQIQTTLTTAMLIILVAISLIAELPIAFMHFLVYCSMNRCFDGVTDIYNRTEFILRLSPCILHVTFPINFVLYCAMSGEFRNTALGMLKKVLCSKGMTRTSVTQID